MKIKNAKGETGAQESRRRARILERYVAIERPTAAEDESAAAELGMSVDSMLRMAAGWRKHKSETLLVGQAAALKRNGEASREKIMAATIDLDLVRPDRRTEILRKIRIIQRYLAGTELGRDTADAAEIAAAEMGVSLGRFQVITQTWMLLARAEALPGATRRATSWRREPTYSRRRDLLKSTLEKHRLERNLRVVYDAFLIACANENLKPLSLPRFYGIVQELRKTQDGSE